MDVLIVDDDRISRQYLRRQLERWGHRVVEAEDAFQAWDALNTGEMSLVISDWQMPEMSGLELVQKIRRTLTQRYIYTILLTSRSDPQDLIEGMDSGADDFLTKPFNSGELRVRLRAGERVVELERALAERNRQMRADLDAAARFARSLLPSPLQVPWPLEYQYLPSAVVSGDALGYHWIDHEAFAVYLLDVTGHGLDAALLATTLINVLRSGSLPRTDLRDPAAVLSALNATFTMENYGEKCFTIWYGVISRSARELRWAGGGHPPAALFSPGQGEAQLLRSTGPLLGGIEWDYGVKQLVIPDGSTLYLYSDGAYELHLETGPWPHAEFLQVMQQHCESGAPLDTLVTTLQAMNGGPEFADDLSLIRVRF